MSLLHADLPSEDEADDDYDPSRDDKADEAGRQKIAKRRRGSAAYPDTPQADDNEPEPSIERPERDNPSSLAKKAKVDQLWAQLNKGKATAKAPMKEAAQSAEAAPMHQASESQPLSLAAICRPVTKKQKADSDTHWKRQLGITSVHTQDKDADEDSKQRAAAAAAAAAAAQGKTESKTITETRRFAGRDIQYKRAATEHDAKATKAQDIKKGGLDALLGSLQQAKKVNVLDKSRMDWGDFKSSDVKVDEELEGYKKSGDKYLDKVDFLKRAELRQYEKERDQRLSQDMRSRGRL